VGIDVDAELDNTLVEYWGYIGVRERSELMFDSEEIGTVVENVAPGVSRDREDESRGLEAGRTLVDEAGTWLLE
jgi:hypothetical protein